jgi:hypothetical protein
VSAIVVVPGRDWIWGGLGEEREGGEPKDNSGRSNLRAGGVTARACGFAGPSPSLPLPFIDLRTLDPCQKNWLKFLLVKVRHFIFLLSPIPSCPSLLPSFPPQFRTENHAMKQKQAITVHIDILSDTICPWCYMWVCNRHLWHVGCMNRHCVRAVLHASCLLIPLHIVSFLPLLDTCNYQHVTPPLPNHHIMSPLGI